jgi:hypothetical protein
MVVGPNTRENCLAERTTIFIKKKKERKKGLQYIERKIAQGPSTPVTCGRLAAIWVLGGREPVD